jgi:hypothetical protein
MKDFIPYQESLELKQLGFDEECFAYFKDEEFQYPNLYEPFKNSEIKSWCITAPLYQQAFRWFREKYNLPSTIMHRVSIDDGGICYDWLILGQDVKYRHFDTYEDAELACLSKLIAIVKEKQ